MYLDIGFPVFAPSMTISGVPSSLPDSRTSSTSSNQALPIARPQPPKRQVTSRASLAPASNSTSTRVQSCVPVTGGVRHSPSPLMLI